MAACTLVFLWGACFQFGQKRFWPTLVPCALFAFHPWAIDHAAVFRVYSTATAVGAGYFWAVSVVLCQPYAGTRGRTIGLGFAACLLPQLHYYWFPVLIGSGTSLYIMGHRRAAMAHVPALLCTLPWLLFMWVNPSHQNPTSMVGAWDALTMMTQTGSHFGVYWTAPLTVIGCLVFPWLSTSTRYAYVGTLGFMALTVGISVIQMVRQPISLFALLWICVFLAGLLGQLYPKRGHPIIPTLLSLCLLGGYGATFREAPLSSSERIQPPNSVLAFTRAMQHNMDSLPAPVDKVVVRPEYYLPVVHLYQTSLPISVTEVPCSKVRHCYTLDGVRYDTDIRQVTPDHNVVFFDAGWMPTTPPEHCRPLEQRTTYALWWCPKSEPTRHPNQ